MAGYIDRTYGKFDPERQLVALRQMTLMDDELNGGDPIDAEKVPQDIRCRLWMTRYADYVEDYRPTQELPVTADESASDDGGDGEPPLVEYVHSGGGWYLVKAPWLDEPVKIKGEAAAKEEVARLIAAGPPQQPASSEEDEGGEGNDTGE